MRSGTVQHEPNECMDPFVINGIGHTAEHCVQHRTIDHGGEDAGIDIVADLTT